MGTYPQKKKVYFGGKLLRRKKKKKKKGTEFKKFWGNKPENGRLAAVVNLSEAKEGTLGPQTFFCERKKTSREREFGRETRS